MLYLDKQIKSSNAYIISIFFIIWISNNIVWSVRQHPVLYVVVAGWNRIQKLDFAKFRGMSHCWDVIRLHWQLRRSINTKKYQMQMSIFSPFSLAAGRWNFFFCFALITWFIELVRQTSKVHWVNDVISCQFLCFVNIKRGHLKLSQWSSFSSREIVYLDA